MANHSCNSVPHRAAATFVILKIDDTKYITSLDTESDGDKCKRKSNDALREATTAPSSQGGRTREIDVYSAEQDQYRQRHCPPETGEVAMTVIVQRLPRQLRCGTQMAMT